MGNRHLQSMGAVGEPRRAKTMKNDAKMAWWEPLLELLLTPAGLICLVIGSCTAYIYSREPPSQAELNDAVRQANQEYAQECQDLFAVWNAGLATDAQKERLQDCIRDFGEL